MTETVRVVVDSLIAAGVEYVFGVPGAKIDSLFNELLDHPKIKLVVCRHEQNAAFMAAAVGRLTGRPGVCIATSGPGTSNLVTGLVTANDEGYPVVAIVGSVKRAQALKRTHQSLRGVELLTPVTKKSAAAVVENQIAEIILDAFRAASSFPRGATSVTLPADIMLASVSKTTVPAFPSSAYLPPSYGTAANEVLDQAAALISGAKAPILFLGQRAIDAEIVASIHKFLRKHPVPVIETFQAAGAISKELKHLFYGRVGLFHNQPGDKLLSEADLVVTIGYDQAEYDADQWNTDCRLDILHLDFVQADHVQCYSPKLEVIGSLTANIDAIADRVTEVARLQDTAAGKRIVAEQQDWQSSEVATAKTDGPVQPLYFIRLLQSLLDEETVVTCDVGSIYVYFSRYFYSYKPKTFLTSNVQQTLGVGLPWAIGASLCQKPTPCSKKVVSISGDGGFMFSSQELSTAVQLGCNITHFIWNDGKYNMVEFQEVDKYGRSAGIDLGGVDFVKFAESFGAKGLRANNSKELDAVVKEALSYDGVCIVDVTIDYSKNHDLMKQITAENVN